MKVVYIRQTPMGAYTWQLFNSTTGALIAQSVDYGSRDEALASAKHMAEDWLEGYSNIKDQTPEGKRGL